MCALSALVTLTLLHIRIEASSSCVAVAFLLASLRNYTMIRLELLSHMPLLGL